MITRAMMLVSSVVVLAGCSAGRQAQWVSAKSSAVSSEATGFEALVAAGEANWAKRGDRPALEAAIADWEKALALKDDANLWARLSRAYYFLADAHVRKEGDKSEAYLSTFEKGVAAGERGLAAANADFRTAVTSGKRVEEAMGTVGQEGVEAGYWYASNLGKWARAKGFATTVGNKDKIKAVMDRILAVDPNFFHGAANRYFGAYYGVAPGFAGGDMNKSKENFEKSLTLAPNYIGTKVLFADIYAVKQQDRALFEKLLADVLAAPDDIIPGLEAETRNEKAKAQELKARADELF